MTFGSNVLKKGSLYKHTLTYFHGTLIKWSLGRVTHVTSTEVGSKVILMSLTFWLSFGKMTLYPHSFIFYHGSWTNITMIVKVCDCKSRRDSWFENRRVCLCFCVCGRQKQECPQLEFHGWRCHYMEGYRSSGISGLYLWCIKTQRKLSFLVELNST